MKTYSKIRLPCDIFTTMELPYNKITDDVAAV